MTQRCAAQSVDCSPYARRGTLLLIEHGMYVRHVLQVGTMQSTRARLHAVHVPWCARVGSRTVRASECRSTCSANRVP
jgi:hypothetical protein